MTSSFDNPFACSFTLKLSMSGVASSVSLSTYDFVCLVLSKGLKHLEVTSDSLLTFAKAEGAKTAFLI